MGVEPTSDDWKSPILAVVLLVHVYLKQVMGIEPISQRWQRHILTTVLYLHVV